MDDDSINPVGKLQKAMVAGNRQGARESLALYSPQLDLGVRTA